MSTAEHMSDVEAHAAITDTILNYAEYVDGGEIELWAGLFCQDAIFDEGTVVTGRPSRRCYRNFFDYSRQRLTTSAISG